MSQDVNGNMKLFWKEMSKVESCSRVKEGMGGWHFERLRWEGFGKNVLKIFSPYVWL